jgi:ABC-type branched-subunit amino acid transport system substrate-binding protein
MKKPTLVVLGVCLALFVFTVAVPMTSFAQQKVLKIGCVTNFNTKEGVEIKKWHDLFAKVINAQGGWKIGKDTYKLEFLTYDNKGDQPATRAALEKLIYQDKVNYIVDNFLASESLTSELCGQAKIICTGEGFQPDATKPTVEYYWRANGIYFARAFHYTVYSDYYKKGARVGLVVTPDQGEARDVLPNAYGDVMKLIGYKVLPPVFFPMDTVDFGPIATKIKASGADMIDLGGSGGQIAVSIITALYDIGWKGYISPSSVNENQLGNIVKKVGNWFDGSECLFFDPRGIQKDPAMVKWLDEYVKEYKTFNESGTNWVRGFFILKDAIENTKSTDVATLKKYLDKHPHAVMSLCGYVQLLARPDMNNFRTVDATHSHPIGIIKNGKMEAYKIVSLRDQYLVSIKSNHLVDVYKKYWEKYGKPTFPKDDKPIFEYADLDK